MRGPVPGLKGPPAPQPKKLFSDADGMPLDGEGRTYHLGIKAGEVADRILSVGDAGRAERIAALLEPSRLKHRRLQLC